MEFCVKWLNDKADSFWQIIQTKRQMRQGKRTVDFFPL